MGQPHNKYKHLFVVVRLNMAPDSTGASEISEDNVMLTKAFFNQVDAEEEASRLNGQNKEFWHYFVCVARLAADPRAEE